MYLLSIACILCRVTPSPDHLESLGQDACPFALKLVSSLPEFVGASRGAEPTVSLTFKSSDLE